MNDVKQKTSKMPVWAILLIVFLGVMPVLLVFGSIAYVVFSDEMDSDLDKVRPSNVLTLYDEENGSYVVRGTLTNNLDEDYLDISIFYKLYDKNNNVIGYASDYIEELDEGETWSFACEYYGLDASDVARVEFDEVESTWE